MSDKIFSSHIFMFPFRFDLGYGEKYSNEFDFYKTKTIDERLKDLDKFKGWELEHFDLKQEIRNHNDKMYNEYAYFYDYARDAIYNIEGDDDPISLYFEPELGLRDAKFQIDILNGNSYTLDMVGLSLRIFNTGIGILSIELENIDEKQSNFGDILKINDFGRRIYPQFIKNPKNPKLKFKKHPNIDAFKYKPFDIEYYCIKDSANEAKNSFLANKITITGVNEEPKKFKKSIIESFLFKPNNDIVIGGHIMQLLGESFTQRKQETEKYYIQPILDDRMFVISWHGSNVFSRQLVDENYTTNDNWYKYVFVDGEDKTVFSPKMQTKLIKEATYDRWMNYQYGLTLYGISRYSFVCLSNDSDFSKNVLPLPHIKTMYFQMVTLLLATRASILRFSDEIAALASNKQLDTTKLNRLYQRYLTFYNRLYFKEVTHQDQGIELYDIARKQMNIDEHMEKLDKKFTKLFEFAELQSSNEGSESMDKLTIMGALFLPPSLLVALFSMGIYDYDKSSTSLFIGLGATFVSAILGYIAIRNIIKKRKNNAEK